MKKKLLDDFKSFALKLFKDAQSKKFKPKQVLGRKIGELIDCTEDDLKKIGKKYGFEKIADLAAWAENKKSTEIAEGAKALEISLPKWENWIIFAKMAKNLSQSKIVKQISEYSFKILFAGLDNAGKTSIINYYIESQRSDESASTKPTLGLNSSIKSKDNSSLSIWELGGQVRYREQYLAHPEIFFLNSALLVFTIDIQDSKRFSQSYLYLMQILKIFTKFDVQCGLLLLFHKSDPEFPVSILN